MGEGFSFEVTRQAKSTLYIYYAGKVAVLLFKCWTSFDNGMWRQAPASPIGIRGFDIELICWGDGSSLTLFTNVKF